MQLQSKRVIITGAGTGIGRACALACAREGARVALASRTRAELQRASREIENAGGTALVAPCDVTREEDVHLLFARVRDEWKGVDGVVNCAAIFRKAPLADMPLALWNEVLDVNLTGTFLCCREALRQLEPGGSVVNLSSLSGVPGTDKFPGFGAYNVSKYGVAGLTELMAKESAARGIRVNCLSPGAVDTEMLKQAAPELTAAMSPEEVASVVVCLLSDAGYAVHGANVALASVPAASPALAGRR